MSDKKQQQSAPVNSTSSETQETKPSERGNLPLSQAETVERLQGTIGQLEGIVAQLRAKSAQNLPPQTIVETLVTTTQAIADFVQQEESGKATSVKEVTEKTGTESPGVVTGKKHTEESAALPSQPKLERSSPAGIFAKIRSLFANWKLIGILSGVSSRGGGGSISTA